MKLPEILPLLIPANEESDKLEISSGKDSYLLSLQIPKTENLTNSGVPIRRIIFINQPPNNTRIVLQFTTNKSQDGRVPPAVAVYKPKDNEAYTEIYNCLLQNGAILSKAFTFCNQKVGEIDGAPLWDRPLKDIYSDREINFYNWSHKEVAKQLKRKIGTNYNLLQKAKKKGVVIISLGCGTGNELDMCANEIRDLAKELSLFGIDTNNESIKTANQCYSKLGAKFIVGDILNLAQIFKCYNIVETVAGKVVIVLGFGSLARAVLDNNYSATQVLQQLSRNNICDILMLAGRTATLISKFSANAIGWDIANDIFTALSDTDYLKIDKNVTIFGDLDALIPIYTLTRCNPDNFIERMHQESIARSRHRELTILDLAMSAKPLEMLEKSLKPKEITQIDLSWSYFTDDEIDELPDVLAKYTGLRNIMVSGDEPWFDKFMRVMKDLDQYNIFKRTDGVVLGDIPMLPPPVSKAVSGTGIPHKKLFAMTDLDVKTPPPP